MANHLDAQIKLLYPADDGSFFTADTVPLGSPFDVVANVEIGEDLMEVVDQDELIVTIRNVSQSTTIAQQTLTQTLPPQKAPLNQELRADFEPGWETGAAVGDILEAVASYTVTAGVFVDHSIASSNRFVVTA
jgi:hypothetical protein